MCRVELTGNHCKSACSDGFAKIIDSDASVLALVLWENLYNNQSALPLFQVHIDLEVRAWFDGAAIKVPGNLGSWVASEFHLGWGKKIGVSLSFENIGHEFTKF